MLQQISTTYLVTICYWQGFNILLVTQWYYYILLVQWCVSFSSLWCIMGGLRDSSASIPPRFTTLCNISESLSSINNQFSNTIVVNTTADHYYYYENWQTTLKPTGSTTPSGPSIPGLYTTSLQGPTMIQRADTTASTKRPQTRRSHSTSLSHFFMKKQHFCLHN